MGNKASAQLLPPVDVMLKSFSPIELQALEARFPTAPSSSTNHSSSSSSSGGGRKRSGSKESSPHSTLAIVTKAQFVALLGEGFGPSMKRLLLRLFAVLDANGTGALEYQEHVSALYFFNHATAAERARVLFSMYEPTSSFSSLSSPSATAASKAYLSKEHVATLCAETTMALTEMQATPASVMASFSEGGDVSRGGCIIAQPSAPAPAAVSLTNINALAAPFRELIGAMVDVAFLRWDADKDSKLSLSEFTAFVTQQNDNGVDELLGKLLASPQVLKLLFDGADGGGERESRR